MNIVRAGVVLAGVLAFPSFAHAEWTGSAVYRACIKEAGESDASMTECAHDELDREDKRLNASYVTVMKEADVKLKDAIRASQKAWISYRDLTCDVLMADGAGTLERLMHAECEARMTAERADWLGSIKP